VRRIGIGFDEVLSAAVAVVAGHESGELADELDSAFFALLFIVDALVFGDGSGRGHTCLQHGHRRCVFGETLDDGAKLGRELAGTAHAARKVRELRFAGKLPVDEQEGGFFERAVLGEILDEDAAIFQDALFAVDPTDGRLGCRDIFKAGNVLDHFRWLLVRRCCSRTYTIEKGPVQATLGGRKSRPDGF
jgi:hypothetical protein